MLVIPENEYDRFLKPDDFDTLHIPQEIRKCAELESGIILMSGAGRTGKRTTMISLADIIGRDGKEILSALHFPVVSETSNFVNVCREPVPVNEDTFPVDMEELKKFNKQCEDSKVNAKKELNTKIDKGYRCVVLEEINNGPKQISLALEAAKSGSLVLISIHGRSYQDSLSRLILVMDGNGMKDRIPEMVEELKAVIHHNLTYIEDELAIQTGMLNMNNSIRDTIISAPTTDYEALSAKLKREIETKNCEMTVPNESTTRFHKDSFKNQNQK